jgi:DNA polymerase-3 subunit epsilon
MLMQELAFVDLETSGSTAGTDRITEIGIVTVDPDGTVKTWQQLLNPQTRIPPFIQQLTGISNAMVANAPVFAEVAGAVMERLSGRLFIAHNARFDYGFLKAEFKRLDITFRAPVVCTVKLSRSLFPEHKKHNLDALIERHDLQAEARHRALADAQLIHQFWQKMQVDRDSDTFQSALQLQNPHPNLPAHFDAGILEDLPNTAGVYIFHGADDQALYIGKAKDIRKKVISHFAANKHSAQDKHLQQHIRRIHFIEIIDEFAAKHQETLLIAQLKPLFNQARRKTPSPTDK